MSTPSPTDFAYIAGYFDGEGYFHTTANRQRNNLGIGWALGVAVRIETTDLQTLDWIFDTLRAAGMKGGHRWQKERRTNVGTLYGFITWARRDDVALFCELVGPYLINKRQQMELIRDRLMPLLRYKGRRWWNRPLFLEASRIKDEVDALKQRRTVWAGRQRTANFFQGLWPEIQATTLFPSQESAAEVHHQ